MSNDAINLPDIPDLSGIGDSPSDFTPFEDGWYKGVILEKREFVDRNGNTRVFESADQPSQNGDSRNIKLQVQVTRQADKATLNVSTLVNYRPDDLTAATVQAVKVVQEQVKEGAAEWKGNPLSRSFFALQSLQKIQKVAGVRQLQRNGNGGLDLSAVYGKEAYIRIKPDERNPQYKTVADIRPITEKAPRQLQ